VILSLKEAKMNGQLEKKKWQIPDRIALDKQSEEEKLVKKVESFFAPRSAVGVLL
jgi:hypothetical protein